MYKLNSQLINLFIFFVKHLKSFSNESTNRKPVGKEAGWHAS